ncbi:MAG: LPS-assembly protein LptD, partial [Prevotellaceae bacterium]|nr:LPS-assembly protein LptD [Prevotellaceae bacterium]
MFTNLNRYIAFWTFLLLGSAAMAQAIPVDSVRTLDAMPLVTDSLRNLDSTLLVRDSTLVLDSLHMPDSTMLMQDSVGVENGISDDAITDPIFSEGRDSTVFVLGGERRVLIYGNAKVTMEDMELTADFIDFNMDSKIAFARGTYDTLGNVTGRPVFKQGSETYTMDSMYYNFESQKAKIYTVVTQQQDGYLHGDAIKRMPDNTIYVKDGKYTSCDHEHPHYYMALTKAKVIPNDKVVFGPAYFVLEDVPTPLIIPFGLFPQSSSRSSGIIVPSYGEEVRRGFYFREGGYYFAFNDYVDLAITGDIFTLGSWRVGARSSYAWNYKFNGGFNVNYAANIAGEKGS